MTTGQLVLVAAVLLAVGLGLWRAVTDGRFRAVRGLETLAGARSSTDEGPLVEEGVQRPSRDQSILAGTEHADQLGERATLLQFSSAFCAPCRVTRRTLGEVADLVDGVAHVEVDAESQLDLVRRLGVLRTPTTLVLDAEGREVTRAAGAPSKQQVLSALGAATSGEST